MGSGKNGTFDKVPDLKQWAIFSVQDEIPYCQHDEMLQLIYGKMIAGWVKNFAVESLMICLNPIVGHGTWDQKNIFDQLPKQTSHEGVTATLTRATIRPSKLKHFWMHVAPVASQMNDAPGYLFSVGIGEVPWIKQATFSVWSSMEAMKQFAYRQKEHAEVIKKTRSEKWYSEDMFVRFGILHSSGTLKGVNPLAEKD